MTSVETNAACGWTIGEIAARLGITSAVFQKARFGTQEVARIAQAGIRYLELTVAPLDLSVTPRSVDHRDQKQMSEVIAACETHGVQIAVMHGPVLAYDAKDQAERKAAVKEGLAVARVAVELGAHIMVNHFRINAYTRRSIHELLDQTASLPVTLGAENLEEDEGSIEKVLGLVDEFDSDRLKMVLDIGHELDDDGKNPFTEKDRARSAVTQCEGRIVHVHLHETLAHAYKKRPGEQPPLRHLDHQPPLHKDGIIEWGEVFMGLNDINYA